MSRHTELIEIDDVLGHPHWFLSRLDLDRREFVFLETTREILSGAAFVDGRTALSSTGRSVRVGCDAALDWAERRGLNPGPDRLIVHVAFCGSTLLARALDSPGMCLPYKEPQVLIDLAALKVKRRPEGGEDAGFPRLVELVMGQLRKTFAQNERSVVKPSNWPITLVADLVESQRDVRAVVMDTEPEDYLVSVLRGGQERMSYVLKFLINLRAGFPAAGDFIAEVEREDLQPVERMMRFAMIALRSQQDIYAGLMKCASGSPAVKVTYQDLIRDPHSSVARASTALETGHDEGALDEAIDKAFSRYSKDVRQPFDRKRHSQTDKAILLQYHREIHSALAWSERVFPLPKAP